MRVIKAKPILLFFALFLPTTCLSIALSDGLINQSGLLNPVLVSGVYVALFYALNTLVYRLFLSVMPMSEGEYQIDSKEDFIYQVYVIYYLLMFNSLTPHY